MTFRRLIIACAVSAALCDDQTHQYSESESVVLWTDRIGPYNNPQETYPFESIGICELQGVELTRRDDLSIGEALEGHEFVSSPKYEINFGVPVSQTKTVCEMTVDDYMSKRLEAMIQENYWYQLYVDDLPIWAFLGEPTTSVGELISNVKFNNEPSGKDKKRRAQIYTHRHFEIYKNNNQIIQVDMEPQNPAPVKSGTKLKFTYDVVWKNSDRLFKNRFEKYLEVNFFEHKVHWFSIVNSFMLCLFLIAVVVIILMKTLKKDLTRYAVTEQEELESIDRTNDESGWKQIHGDVFRRPAHLLILSVVYSSGIHILSMLFGTILLAIANSYYTQRGTTGTSMVVCYIITTVVSGYAGGHIFKLYGGKSWKKAMISQVLFLPGLLFVTFIFVNTTAWAYGSTYAMPFKKVVLFMVLFSCLCVPLHTFGTLVGRKRASSVAFPCRVHHLKRPIPPKSDAFIPTVFAASGLIPFGCVFIEMYFLFSSFWSFNKVYYVYGFMLAILILMTLVIICVAITCVYVFLNAEDHRWGWQSFLCTSTTSLYVFLYSVYYYYYSTNMSGLLQWVYYFGATGLFCVSFGLMCGAVGFLGASYFVFLIYGNIKSD